MKRKSALKKRAPVLCLLASIILLLLIAGCGAAPGSGGNYSAAPQATTAAATTAAAALHYRTESYDAADMAANELYDYDEEFDVQILGLTGEGAAVQVRKEIKNVNCTLVVKDVQAAYDYISETVNRLDGYEFSKTEYNRENWKQFYLTLKLPPEHLPEFELALRSVEGVNALRHYNLSSDDITSAYYDTAARLESMKASLVQYHALLAKAGSIKDMLEIQREITRLQADIESMQGQMNMWNLLVRYATINLTIEREDDPLAQSRNEVWSFNSPSEIVNAMVNGFINTGNVVYRFFVGMFVVLVSLLPALVPIGIIVVIILVIRRKRKLKRGLRPVTDKKRKRPGKKSATPARDAAGSPGNLPVSLDDVQTDDIQEIPPVVQPYIDEARQDKPDDN